MYSNTKIQCIESVNGQSLFSFVPKLFWLKSEWFKNFDRVQEMHLLVYFDWSKRFQMVNYMYITVGKCQCLVINIHVHTWVNLLRGAPNKYFIKYSSLFFHSIWVFLYLIYRKIALNDWKKITHSSSIFIHINN